MLDRSDASLTGCAAHTVDLYDFGVTEDQTLYLVMEFLDGMDLDSLVQRHGPMPATLEDLVLACLAKKPEERPRNARQLVQSLDAIDGMTWDEDEAIR